MSDGDRLRAATFATASLLAVLVTLAVFWGAEPAEAAFAGTPGAIAFIKGGEVFRMDGDGFRQTRLSDGTKPYDSVSWSADGREVVAQKVTGPSDSQANDIVVLKADGTGEQNLTNSADFDESEPSFSKDGDRIFYARKPRLGGEKFDIYMLDRTQPGAVPVQVTNTPAVEEREPAVSPNGKRLLFTSDRDGNYEIYVMKAAPESPSTNVPKRLSKSSPGQSFVDLEASAEWSPDGTQIVFGSTRTGEAEIFRMKAKPEGRRNRPVNLSRNAVFEDTDPAWSPDGRKIAFTCRVSVSSSFDVCSMNATNGANKTNVSNDPTTNDKNPHWQPLS